MKSSLTAEAEQELVDGALFYQQQANAELGHAFITEFERVLALLLNQPKLGPVWRGKTRRMPLRRFPFNLVYEVRAAEIRVIALAHQRRKPGFWRGRA